VRRTATLSRKIFPAQDDIKSDERPHSEIGDGYTRETARISARRVPAKVVVVYAPDVDLGAASKFWEASVFAESGWGQGTAVRRRISGASRKCARCWVSHWGD